MENILQIEKLQKKIKKKEILCNITCKLENGVYGLLGPNGAGKTTLMRCITGLYSFHGKIKYNNTKVNAKGCQKIGYLPQKFGLFPELTVHEMMVYMCNIRKIDRKLREEEIEKCLRKVNLLDQKNTRIKKLSGGMVRRLGIAQTLLADPPILLFDEPTAGLDPEERMRFKDIVSNLSKDKIVIVSTHIVDDVEACCDSVIVLDQGEIVRIGSIEEIQNYASGRVKEVSEAELDNEKIVYVEKSFLRNGNKIFRVLLREREVETVEATVEDGYLCLLKVK